MPNEEKKTVCVVGLGLMGGSFAAAVRASGTCATVYGLDRAPHVVGCALARGIVDEAVASIEEAANRADIIVLAAPVRQIIACLKELARCPARTCSVIDVGSTKREVVAAMASLPASVSAVGGHPMCGGSHHGPENARADLFRGKVFALCGVPGREGPSGWAQDLVRAVGAEPLWLDADEHDRAVALVSHLPFALSTLLMSTARRAGAGDPAWRLAAGGFRVMTSLSLGDGDMWRDILLTNRDMMIPLLRMVRRRSTDLEALLGAEDVEGLDRMLAAARQSAAGLDAERLEEG